MNNDHCYCAEGRLEHSHCDRDPIQDLADDFYDLYHDLSGSLGLKRGWIVNSLRKNGADPTLDAVKATAEAVQDGRVCKCNVCASKYFHGVLRNHKANEYGGRNAQN
jgi:hypothetical protein